ncbi:MAG: TlpA family protein disulfide reductase [Acidobacteria bacterium]|nr:TlpA family protein disulfide reductase [Acidobacteriota bacterium]
MAMRRLLTGSSCSVFRGRSKLAVWQAMRKLPLKSAVAVGLLAILLETAFLRSSWAQDPAPTFELPDQQGQLHRLEEFRGKVVVLNFWATWCAPCAAEMPIFVEANRRYGARGVAILAVSLDAAETKGAIPQFIQKRKIAFPVLVDATVDNLELFGLGDALPSTVFLDPEGRIIYRILGEAKKKDVFQRVEWLLGDHKGKEPQALLSKLPKPR